MTRDASMQARCTDTIVETVLDRVLATAPAQSRTPMLVGLSGLQGCGKSTFARQFGARANARGVLTQVLSLDDFYLGRRARADLARSVHPLLATRGVPGTHDIDLLAFTLRKLAHASERGPARIPRFDKGRDTRVTPSRWRQVTHAPRLILLEGWCVGVPPQSARALVHPLNALERDEDRDGRWRRWVNARLARAYAGLWKEIEALIVLEAPGFALVPRWRDEQERALRNRHAPQAMDRASLARFLLHYERLSRHALRELPARADVRVLLRADRSVRRLVIA